MNNKKLIAEAREQAAYLRGVSRDGSMPYSGDLLESLADALEAAGRERATVPDAATELAAIKARADEVGEDEGWHIGGAWGDYGEVVVPLRILSYVVDGALDEKIVSTDPGYAATYAEQVARADRAEAERDAALARIAEAAKLHRRRDDLEYRWGGGSVCDGCGDEDGWASKWPCPTAVSLGLNEGENDD